MSPESESYVKDLMSRAAGIANVKSLFAELTLNNEVLREALYIAVHEIEEQRVQIKSLQAKIKENAKAGKPTAKKV